MTKTSNLTNLIKNIIVFFRLIDWCLMPTLTVFQLYRGFFRMRLKGYVI